MDWTRGDVHYGPDFVALHSSCQGQNISECECSAAFKVTRTAEFADYIASFGQKKVPVVYNVWRRPDGRIVGAKLSRVGDWSSDHFQPNDGLLAIGHTFKPGHLRSKEAWNIAGLGSCFPQLDR